MKHKSSSMMVTYPKKPCWVGLVIGVFCSARPFKPGVHIGRLKYAEALF
jgi:hypothetical protein